MTNIRAAIVRGDLVGAGWRQLSENVFERRGYTARLDVSEGAMVVTSPIGTRAVRRFSK